MHMVNHLFVMGIVALTLLCKNGVALRMVVEARRIEPKEDGKKRAVLQLNIKEISGMVEVKRVKKCRKATACCHLCDGQIRCAMNWRWVEGLNVMVEQWIDGAQLFKPRLARAFIQLSCCAACHCTYPSHRDGSVLSSLITAVASLLNGSEKKHMYALCAILMILPCKTETDISRMYRALDSELHWN